MRQRPQLGQLNQSRRSFDGKHGWRPSHFDNSNDELSRFCFLPNDQPEPERVLETKEGSAGRGSPCERGASAMCCFFGPLVGVVRAVMVRTLLFFFDFRCDSPPTSARFRTISMRTAICFRRTCRCLSAKIGITPRTMSNSAPSLQQNSSSWQRNLRE